MENELIQWAGGVLFAGFTAATGLLYRGTQARIQRVEDAVTTKASEEEMVRTREKIGELFRTCTSIQVNMVTREEFGALRDIIIARLPLRGE
jgi:hypothetical protein